MDDEEVLEEEALTEQEQQELDSTRIDTSGLVGGETIGVQPVEELLGDLIRAGELKVKEANDIIDLVGDDADVHKTAGLIAGEFGVAPKDIARNTDIDIDASKVEEHKRDWKTTVGQLGYSGASAIRSYLGAVPEAVQDVTGFRGFGTGQAVFDDDAGIAGALIDTPEEAREKRARAEIRDDTRKVIDLLHEAGEITDAQATKMKSVTDNYDTKTYQNLLTEIESELEGFEYTSEGQARFITENLADLRSRIPTISDGKPGITDEEAEPESVEGATGELDTSTINSFTQLVEMAGIMSTQAGLPEGPAGAELDYIWVEGQKINLEPIGPGKGGIYDPLYVKDDNIYGTGSGAVMSNSQMDAILASDILKQRYAELGKQQGYSASVTALIESNTFKPRREGGRGLPIENIEGTIPTLVVTEGWQRPLYDWDAGSGQAQWQGMAAYSRRAKVDYMVQTGLIRDDERARYYDSNSILGGQMWEAVNGVSRGGQMSQYEAMKQLGGVATDVRDQLRGTGSGARSIAPKYSVPASLREVPDYKALATQTRELFRPTLGRDMEDWELAFLSDELGEQYKTRNDQLIQAHKAAWDDAVAGGTVNVDDIEVTDPGSALTFDIEDRYSDELGRQEDVEEYGTSRQLLMDSIAVGQRMQ